MLSLKTKTKDKFFSFYWKVQKKLVPGLTNSQYYYKSVLKAHVHERSQWLDLGCGHQLLPEWMPSSQQEQARMASCSDIIIGMDYDITSLKKHKHIKYLVVGDMHNLPFKKHVFNIITANVVVEHVANPKKAFGGVQMIFVGDLYQLPPVVTSKEKAIFTTHYKTPYFFSAHAFSNFEIEIIELEKVYRQKDHEFIEFLKVT